MESVFKESITNPSCSIMTMGVVDVHVMESNASHRFHQ